FFYRSFVKQYAAILGVDPKLIQTGLDALTKPAVPEPQPSDPIPAATSRIHFGHRPVLKSLIGLGVTLLGSSGVYSWWTRPPKAAVVPTQHIATSPVPAPAPEVPAPEVKVTSIQEPDGTNRVSLNLSATEKTWLSVTSGGRMIFSGILEPSQTKT